jgi:exo-1,4-beta-D-glucosaminidase
MITRRRILLTLSGLLVTTFLFSAAAHSSDKIPVSGKFLLHRDWQLQSSCEMKADGTAISQPGFATVGWHRAEVPTTVVAALVADKTYPEPYFGKNLKSFPGMDYPATTFFANSDMPENSPFRCSWWFRTEFRVPAELAGRKIWLHFDGLNYRGNVWLNGKKIADAQDVAGTYRAFEFEINPVSSKSNALAVEVFAPEKNDLELTWVDWNPTPADKNLGLWKDVYLSASGAVSLRHGFVSSALRENYTAADLTVSADLHNLSDHPVTSTFWAEIEGRHVSQKITLQPSESRTVQLTPGERPELKLAHPRLWWPYQMGKPELYTARMGVEVNGVPSDAAEVRFGVREVTSQITERGYRLFSVNGRKVLIRGAAWAPDMLLRWSQEQFAAALNYTRDMGLNAIRLEGRMERDEFFDLADELGVLIMPGFTCCDMWERWKEWTQETEKIAAASLRDQVQRLRNHPSVFVWLYGSDNPPPPNIEAMYLQILEDLHWPNPSVSSASEQITTLTGNSGVKMTGPYDYVPPNYWLLDTQAGGAYGFNTETGPGPAIPTLESLKKFIPADHLWPIDDYWNYHAGGERFTTIDKFLNGLNQRYGESKDLNDFLRKSQAMNYEAERAMFEAYGRNKYAATGVIQWMLNNAWPSLIWHLYDYYLAPAGAYFGTKKACEPLHVQYSYDDNSVAVVNGNEHTMPGLKVTAKIYDIESKERGSQEVALEAPPDSAVRALQLTTPEDISSTYFLKLELRDRSGRLVSDNFYWLSKKADALDWAKRADTVYTPQSEYADLTGLNGLQPVKLTVQARVAAQGAEEVIHIEVENPTPQLAFMVHLRATSGGDEDIAPIFWEDNYFSLLPGEKKTLTARFSSAKLPGKTPALVIEGWNVVASRHALVGGRE